MRQVLGEFRDAQDVGDGGPGTVVVGIVGETQSGRATALEDENWKLRERVEA